MTFLTQNKKIAICGISIFIVSFVSIMFFLDDSVYEQHGETNVLHAGEEHEEKIHESDYEGDLVDSEDIMFGVDTTGRFKYLSDEFAELIGVSSEELAGKLLYNYINSQDLPDIVPIFANLFNGKEPVDGSGPYRMIQGDHEIMVMFNMSPVVNDEGVVYEIVFTVKDITDQVKKLNKAVGADEEGNKDEDSTDWLEYVYPHVEDLTSTGSKIVFNR